MSNTVCCTRSLLLQIHYTFMEKWIAFVKRTMFLVSTVYRAASRQMVSEEWIEWIERCLDLMWGTFLTSALMTTWYWEVLIGIAIASLLPTYWNACIFVVSSVIVLSGYGCLHATESVVIYVFAGWKKCNATWIYLFIFSLYLHVCYSILLLYYLT
jgi:hypothetical protein